MRAVRDQSRKSAGDLSIEQLSIDTRVARDLFFFIAAITLGSSHRDRAKTVPSGATLLTILAFLRPARGAS
jgi:hypothetical protein